MTIRSAFSISALVLLAWPESPAHAICNVIPGATTEFRGALGVANRPFASPGDFVGIRVHPQLCDGASPGFVDLEAGSQRSDDYVVTVLFTPPGGGTRNAVVVAEDCAALGAELGVCDATLGAGTVSCVDADAGSGQSGLLVPDDQNLSFRFPDTDDLVDGPSDDRTLTGPAKIVVTDVTEPLPCGLATTRCADAAGLVACLDEFYEIDGTCRTEALGTDAAFAGFTALPPPNSYQAVCSTAGTCTGTADEVHFTVDARGNLLVPFDWSGVRVFLDGVPVPRLVRGRTSVPAFASAPGVPLGVPGRGFVSSHSPEGIRLPPIFTPIVDPEDPSGELVLFGSVDAPRGVSRIARRSPTFHECDGGADDGDPCTEDSDCAAPGTCEQTVCQGGPNAGKKCKKDRQCPSSECGPALFDFGDRLEDGVGPVVVASAEYTADADTAVPLDGLLETPAVFAFAVNEALEGENLNSDADQLDLVMTLGDRELGLGEPLSAVGRVRQPPFSFAAVAAESDVVAYLEPEPAEGNADASADGDVADTILRVFRSDPGGAIDLLAGQDLCADAEPLVAARPLAVSDGLVFFRTPEAACAERLTERVTVTEAGGQASDGGVAPNLSSQTQVVSGDGDLVVFESSSTDMAVGKTTAANDVFLRDRTAGTTTWLSYDTSGGQASASVNRSHVSADGAIVIFDSTASDLVPGGPTDGLRRIYVHEVQAGTTSLLPIPDPGPAGGGGSCPNAAEPGSPCNVVESVSADGRFVVFTSRATNVVPAQGTPGTQTHVFLYDRMLATTELVDLTSVGVVANASSVAGAVSEDGSRVAFSSNATNLDAPDDNPFSDVFVRDRVAGTTTRVSVASDGTQGVGFNLAPTLSADGRLVGFVSDDTLLAPGDTNGLSDTFVRDLETGLTERVSVSSEGLQAEGGASAAAAMSMDGRWIAFHSTATNLVAGDTNTVRDVFVHDRLTGITQRASLRTGGTQTTAQSTGPVSVSEDGQVVSFGSSDTALVAGDTNADPDSFVRAPDPADPNGQDENADGDLRDVHLRVVDATAVSPSASGLGPADAVAVHDGSVALLRPEAAGPAGAADWNGDGDEADDVVHYWANRQIGAPTNLERAATAVALSANWIAALVPETGEGAGDRNGDGDALDTVVELNPVDTLGPGAWTAPSPARAADAIDAVGDVVAFLVPEAAQGGGGGTDLNGDGDKDDRVLQLWDAPTLTNVARAAEDFVLGESVVAFRVSEAAQGAGSLNGDADTADDVLQIWDLLTGQLVSTGQAVIPCRLEACDPRLPYRVAGDTVTFLTLEAHQDGQDLNADGDADDIVVQTFNVRKAIQVSATQARTSLAALGAGVCTDTGEACANDDDCAAGVCYVPPGGCLDDLGIPCGETFPGFFESCLAGETCVLTPGFTSGTCHERLLAPASCRDDSDCAAVSVTAFCSDEDQEVQRLVGPLSSESAGEPVFTSSGQCLEDVAPAVACTDHDDCAPGQLCGVAGGCQIFHGTCATSTDCAAGSCVAELVVAGVADRDGDQVADPYDNCPELENVAQEDGDSDGIGDACDIQTCGDALQVYDEQCDDGNVAGGDGCDATCQLEATPACSNGLDDDGDGDADFPDDGGCSGAADPSERESTRACDDGIDNDDDRLVDFAASPTAPDDPGCANGDSLSESPHCDDDLDNDGDGGVDWDGGAFGGSADAQCASKPWRKCEKAKCGGCGLGFELVLVLPALLWMRGRRRRRD
jgi:cysteine-rich repeat protein